MDLTFLWELKDHWHHKEKQDHCRRFFKEGSQYTSKYFVYLVYLTFLHQWKEQVTEFPGYITLVDFMTVA